MYEVRITQLIAYVNEDEKCVESTGKEETYVVGRFETEPMAKLFAEALDKEISESVEYVTDAYTPRIAIWNVFEEIKEKRVERI